MTVRERLLALKMLERQKENPEYLKKLGIRVDMKEKTEDKNA